MKKIVSLLVIAAIMISSVLPVSAAEITEADREAVYTAWTTRYWESAKKTAEGLAEKNPDMAEEFLAGVQDYEAFCQENCPSAESFDVYEAYGAYDDVSFWRIAKELNKGYGLAYAGGYVFNLTGVIDDGVGCGIYAYADGQLLDVDDAYEAGVVTDEDLAELFAAGNADAVMKRLGDVNGDKAVDVSDILLLKNCIMGEDVKLGAQYIAADVTGDNKYTVGDILGIKNIIMAQ